MLRLNRPDPSNSNGLSFAAGGAGSNIVICRCLPKVKGCFTFPNLWGQETWISAFYKLHYFEEGMFSVGKWVFPYCWTKHWLESKSWIGRLDKVDVVGACLKWASGLSLAAEQSIEVVN